MEYTFIYSELN